MIGITSLKLESYLPKMIISFSSCGYLQSFCSDLKSAFIGSFHTDKSFAGGDEQFFKFDFALFSKIRGRR
jgi:hypothetical protein